MPNDAISREAAIAIVKEHYRAHRSSANVPGNIVGKLNGFAAMELLKLKDALASLPADTRWEELRKDVADAAKLYATLCNEQGDYSADAFRMVLIFMDRLAPAPAEAQD